MTDRPSRSEDRTPRTVVVEAGRLPERPDTLATSFLTVCNTWDDDPPGVPRVVHFPPAEDTAARSGSGVGLSAADLRRSHLAVGRALLSALARAPRLAVIERRLNPAEWALALTCAARIAPSGVAAGHPLDAPVDGRLPVCGTATLIARRAPTPIDHRYEPSLAASEAARLWLEGGAQALPQAEAPGDEPDGGWLGPGNPLARTLETLLSMLGSRAETQALSLEAMFLTALRDDPRLALARRARAEPDGYSPALTERLMHVYMIEGMALLGEGVPPERIETAALRAGFGHGPLWWLDRISLSTLDDILHAGGHGHDHGHGHGHGHAHDHGEAHGHGHDDHDGDPGRPHGHEHAHGHGHAHENAHGHAHAHEHEHEHEHAHGHAHAHAHHHPSGHRDDHGHAHDHGHGHEHVPASGREPMSSSSAAAPMPEPAVYVLEKMAHGFGRLGRDAGGGFYDYEPGYPDELWEGLSAFARGRRRPPADDTEERLLMAITRAALVHRDMQGPARHASSALLPAAPDFPSWTGGPRRWGALLGAGLGPRLDRLAARYGDRFAAPELRPPLPTHGEPHDH